MDYLLLAGSDQVLLHLKEQIYIIKTLLHFQYVDDLGRDHGSCVRQKTKDLLALIEDPDMIADRRNNPHMKDPHSFLAFNDEKYGQNLGGAGGNSSPRNGWSRASSSRTSSPSVLNHNSYSSSREEERQLQMALDASRQQALIDAQRRASLRNNEEDDVELKAALRISAAETSSSSSKKSNDDLIDLFQGPPTASEIHRELSTLSVGMAAPPPPPPQQHYYPTQYAQQLQFSSHYPQQMHQSSGEMWSQPKPNFYVDPSSYPTYSADEKSPLGTQQKYSDCVNNPSSFASDDPFAGLSSELRKSWAFILTF